MIRIRAPKVNAALIGILILAGLAPGIVRAQADMQGFDRNAKPVPDFKLTPFYEWNLEHVGKKPGEVIKTEDIKAPEGAVAWRVMYVSRTWDDRLVPVTGIVVAPKEPGTKPRTVVSWTHGTTGGSRNSAPSLAENPAQNLVQRSPTVPIDYGVPYLTEFLKRGYVVVATDYYGQGAPGVHHYFVGSTVARNALDLVRAARAMKGINAGSEFLALGWSQGGHAALFIGEDQPGYAPELVARGIAAIAPADLTASPHPANIPHTYVLARAYRDAYNVPLTEFTEDGKKLIDAAGDVSITGVFRKSLELKEPFFAKDWSPEFKKALDLNVAGNRKSAAPVLVVHGTADNVAPPEGTKSLESLAKKSGTAIKVSWYEGKDHRSVSAEAQNEILAWFDERLKE